MRKKILLSTITLILIFAISFLYLNRTNKNIVDKQSKTETNELSQYTNWKKYTFDKIGLSFSAPNDLTVSEDQSNDNLFTFSIQRNTYPDPKYYQLYASLQPTGNMGSDAEGIKSQLLDGSKDKIIGGFKAIQGQYKGERNRYVTFIFTDMGILNLATSQPTPENEQTTNSILDTFSFTKNVTEPVANTITDKAIQEILAKKYNKNINEVNVKVKKEVPGFASGSVLFGQGGPGEGGMWLAVLGNGWNIVWDGNGSIDCVKMRETHGIPDTILKPNFCD